MSGLTRAASTTGVREGMLAEEEQDLLRRLRAGDPASFEELVHANLGRMLRLARRILRSEEDARDAVQDAFLKAFERLEDFHGDARLSTWLYRIAVNASLMRLRSRRARPEESIDRLIDGSGWAHHPLDTERSWRPDGEDMLSRKRTIECVRSCIDQLPETYRTVLVLRDVEGLATDEAAEALGLTPAALKTRLHRARQALRALLDPCMRREDSPAARPPLSASRHRSSIRSRHLPTVESPDRSRATPPWREGELNLRG